MSCVALLDAEWKVLTIHGVNSTFLDVVKVFYIGSKAWASVV